MQDDSVTVRGANKELWRRVKIVATTRAVTLAVCFDEAITLWLDRQSAPSQSAEGDDATP